MERRLELVVGTRPNEPVLASAAVAPTPKPRSRGLPLPGVLQVLDFLGPREPLPLVSPVPGVLNLSEPRLFPASSAVGALFFCVFGQNFQVHDLVSLFVAEVCGGQEALLIPLFKVGLPTSSLCSAVVAKGSFHYFRGPRRSPGHRNPHPSLPLHSPWQWLTEQSLPSGRSLFTS